MADDVISLAQKRKDKEDKQAEEAKVAAMSDGDAREYFAQIEAENKKKAEKLAKERTGANKSVLRSYRIKN